MRCPDCSRSLREVDHDGIHLDVCDCGGMWFDRGELERWVAQRRRPPPDLEAARFPAAGREPTRCPRCATASLRQFEAVAVHGACCRDCRGAWMSAADLARLTGGPTTSEWPVVVSGALEFLAAVLI